jgi:hypothetical protein
MAAAIVAAFTLSPSPTFADQRDFTLINGSPTLVITHVHVSASDDNEWGEDILGRDVLGPQESVLIQFSRYDGEAGKCFYDIRVIGNTGGEGLMPRVNLCTTSTVTFS